MFSYFMETIFPALGLYAGVAEYVANMSVNEYLTNLFPSPAEDHFYTVTNLFTGEVISFFNGNSLVWWQGAILEPFRGFVNFMGIGDLPFWVVLLILYVPLVIPYSIIKFLIPLT